MPALTMRSAPSGPKIHVKNYSLFRGVDFSSDPSKVDDRRSPWAPNLISDAGGFPEKRLGWRTVHTFDGPVHGIFFFKNQSGSYQLCHAGSKLWLMGGDAPQLLRSDLHQGRSRAFPMGGKLWILTGGEYLAFDGETVCDASELAYVPVTTVPSSTTERVSYQPVNLLTPKRKNLFIGDGETKSFTLDAASDPGGEVRAWVDEVEVTGVTASGTTVTFSQAPAASVPAGTPNVRVQFEHTTAGAEDRIAHCTCCALYAGRVFLSGNPDYPGVDWHSELDVSGADSAAYIPDTSYTQVGSDDSQVMGYLRAGEALAIIKEDNEQDASVFLRTVQHLDSGDLFPVEQGVSGGGAVSRHCFASLVDDPLFLSKNGVYALASQVVTLERTLQQRSGFVDARLCREQDLDEAVACVWKGYYVLCVNGCCYVADAKQRASRSNETGTWEYEWYYWTNIPARVLCEHAGSLYFGTQDGRLCRMNDDRIDSEGNVRMDAYNDDGQAIVADWATKLDDDGDFMQYKTMPKRGSGVYLKTYTRSGVRVIARTDSDFGRELTHGNASIFTFADIDFSDFTFNTLPENVVPFGQKVKKYKLMQIICRNDALNQGFGVYGIEKRFYLGRTVK